MSGHCSTIIAFTFQLPNPNKRCLAASCSSLHYRWLLPFCHQQSKNSTLYEDHKCVNHASVGITYSPNATPQFRKRTDVPIVHSLHKICLCMHVPTCIQTQAGGYYFTRQEKPSLTVEYCVFKCMDRAMLPTNLINCNFCTEAIQLKSHRSRARMHMHRCILLYFRCYPMLYKHIRHIS